VPYIAPYLFVKGLRQKRRAIKIRARNSIIPPCFASKSFYLYNGRKYLPIAVKPAMCGFKFGEFSLTRFYGSKASKNKKKGKRSK
jgi:small subunit ribosomal protein S19